MPNLNKCLLIGTLTRDPESKFMPNGKAVTEFSLAINSKWTTDSGEKKEDVTFVDCVMFGPRGENITKFCKKGQPLFVEGKLRNESWDDKTTGQKRSKMRVVVDSFEFLSSNKGGSGVDVTSPERIPASKAPVEKEDDSDIPFNSMIQPGWIERLLGFTGIRIGV